MKKIKDIILDEGFRSVIRGGIKSFTVESLASGLSMSKKTIYQYFPKKEILIKKIIDFRMKKLTDEFNEIINQESNSIFQFIKIREHNIKFANGGDRNNETTPNTETTFCNENNVEILWGIGGKHKANSSSWILKRWNDL